MDLQFFKKTWNWVWDSDSFLSWIVAMFLIFIFVKFVFFPVLMIIMGTSLPLAGVESSSMEHQIIREGNSFNLCGIYFDEDEFVNFNKYWEVCGKWYENIGITKEQFSKFNLKDGFSKGDIIIVWGRFTPKVGDIVIFKPNPESTAPRPIIHRIVKIENGILQCPREENEKMMQSSHFRPALDENVSYAIYEFNKNEEKEVWL